MRYIKTVSVLIIIYMVNLFPQTYPPAVEVWSEPVRVDSLSERFEGEWSPSLTTDLAKLFLFKGSQIMVSNKIDTLWTLPTPLNSNINNGNPIRHPSISKDGKRLYYSRWGGYGAWDLWYSKWDSVLKDWGISINLGPTVNGPAGDYFAYELSEDTLYCINDLWAGEGVCIYTKENPSSDWQIVDSSNYFHPLGYGQIIGLSITSDSKKAYFSRYITLPTDSLQSELFVTYWDSVNNRWGDVYELNINSNAYQPDTTNNFYWIGGWDENPWVSSKDKVMYFMSNRDAAKEDTVTIPDIYVSYLLIDENGNPVSVRHKGNGEKINYKLYQNYPNPFNTSTKIRYSIDEVEFVTLKIYDALGRLVTTLVEEIKPPGEYQVDFYTENELASGVYFYQLKAGEFIRTKKLLFLK